MNQMVILFLYFSAYSVIGWICETIYCSYLSHKYINRGFLNGPYCPVYGFGGVLLYYALEPLPHNAGLVFLSGMLLTTTLEYITSVLLETLFHAKWWDYSDHRYNYKGRICLLNSTLFGLLSVAMIFFIQPFLAFVVLLIPPMGRTVVSISLVVIFSADLFVTIRSMHTLNTRLDALSKAIAAAKEKFDLSGFYTAKTLTERFERLHELIETEKDRPAYTALVALRTRIQQLESDNRIFQTRLLKAFPELRSTKHPEILAQIKEKMEQKKRELRERSIQAKKNV
jgi:Predicted membrane protein